MVGFAYLLLNLYVNGLDRATRKGLIVIGSYYAQLYDQGQFDLPLLETKEFSIYIGRENFPEWMASKYPADTIENYKFYKTNNPLSSETGNHIPLFFTAIPIEQGQRKLFAVFHYLPSDEPGVAKSPLIIETVLLITGGICIVLLVAVFWIAHRFNKKVLRPLEGLADMARQVEQNDPKYPPALLNDQSEIGHVAHTLKTGLEKLNQYNQREKQFLQNTSHELRTPITVVGSAVDIIERRLELGKKDITKPLQHIRQASTNMRETTEALLWLSRAEQNTSRHANNSSPLQEYEIDALVNELVDQLGYLIEGRNLNIEITVSTQEIPINDAAFLRIVLSNLIRNAFEHTFEGSVNIAITTEEICVSDTGIGLSGEVDPLQRGKSNRDSFGLGLDIVSKIAELQNWQLLLSNNPEGGCIVTLKW